MKVVVLDGFLAGYGTGGLPLDPARFTVEWYDDTPPRQIAARIARYTGAAESAVARDILICAGDAKA